MEKSIGTKLMDLDLRKDFNNLTPSWESKSQNNQWDYIKLKSFCKAKETFNKTKRQPTEWENIFSNSSVKGLIFKI